ncbi:hypothetical protein KUCAC02_015155 [Chaenocephalus aceratus]|uniref:Uncharacterized protein n=1 Tax=Chaenocephalus aceratus TaxID=36190 RepID=A0ACB9XYW4_CHAAC|nr:hypothetical protein KUCAC02_015155 [Chaenocephalus aceratus]
MVGTTESLNIVLEKTELKVNEEPRSDSCTGGLGSSVGTTAVGSLGGLTGGMGSLFFCPLVRVDLVLPPDGSPLKTCTDSGSAFALQSLFTLERRDDPSAVEMTLLARGRHVGDPLSPALFPQRGGEAVEAAGH